MDIDNCIFPKNTALSGYYYGCRCNRCKTTKTEATRRYRAKHPEKYKETNRNYTLKIKTETFNAYGGCFCACCKEDTFTFLSLDHVYNDGWIRQFGKKTRCGGASTYLPLKRNGYPDKDRYQVLCMNCNFGKKMNNGVCPHKTENING